MKNLIDTKYWLFDLDNTLYSGQTKVFSEVDKKMSSFISKKFNVDLIKAREIQKEYFYEYGTTLSGLMNHDKIDPHEFLEFVHDIDISWLPKDEVLKEVRPEDMMKYGFIPELIGRLPIVSTLQHLDESALMRVLLEPKNSLVKQYKKLFKMEGIELIFRKEALIEIVRLAMERKSGARALRSVMESAMLDLMFNLPEYSEDFVVKITITKEFISKGKKPFMRRHRRSA